MPESLKPEDIIQRSIIALDFSSLEECEVFFKKLESTSIPNPRFFKVGLELFYAEGERILQKLKERGFELFLDLKLHDIPNTVYGASLNLLRYQPRLLNVHASGGIDMMKAARRARDESGSESKLLAVTMLTSLNTECLKRELGLELPLEALVERLALNALEAGLDGVVCSAREAANIHRICGPDFITVCPGIRFAASDNHDQERISTASQAFSQGADYIVLGRAITSAEQPLIALKQLIEESCPT